MICALWLCYVYAAETRLISKVSWCFEYHCSIQPFFPHMSEENNPNALNQMNTLFTPCLPHFSVFRPTIPYPLSHSPPPTTPRVSVSTQIQLGRTMLTLLKGKMDLVASYGAINIPIRRSIRPSSFFTHTHTHSLTHIHTLSLSLSHSQNHTHSHTHTLSLSLSLSLSHTHTTSHTITRRLQNSRKQ